MNKNYFRILLVFVSLLIFTECEEQLIGEQPDNTPVENFDVLWKTLDEKYGLFTVKDINWDELYTRYRPLLSESSTETDLWNVSCQLLSHLNDGHVCLFNKDYTKLYSTEKVTPEKKLGFSLNLVKNKFLDNPKSAGDGFITYGKVKTLNLGYIYFSSFGPAPSRRNWVIDTDVVLKELNNCDGIIVDIRNNGGGFAVNDLYVSASFLSEEIHYFNARLKTGPGHGDLGNPIPKKVAPRNNGTQFTKPNVLLTNRYSASGSEIVALIFKSLPYSTQIGDTTMGCFGDVVHVAQLPNGWTLNYPSVLYRTPDGKCFEGIGIAPDYAIDNTKADIESGIDKILEYSIIYLKEYIEESKR